MSSEKDQVTLATLRKTESVGTDMLELLLDTLSECYDCSKLTVHNFIYPPTIEDKIETNLAKAKCVSFKSEGLISRGYHLTNDYKTDAEENKGGDFKKGCADNSVQSLAKLSEAVVVAIAAEKPLVLLQFNPDIADTIAEKLNGSKCEQVYWHKKNTFHKILRGLLEKRRDLLIKEFSPAVLSAYVSDGDRVCEYEFVDSVQLLGLDVSMSNTGIAALAIINGHKCLLAGSLKSDKELHDFMRGKMAGAQLSTLAMADVASGKKYLVDVTTCEHIAIEGGALGAAQGAYRLGRYCGLIVSNFSALKTILEVAPTRLKKIITGYGFAEKWAVKKFVLEKLLLPDCEWLNEDESDALALLYCKMNENSIDFVSKKRPKKKTAKTPAVK